MELARKRLLIQLKYAENARKKIEDETHPDMHDRLLKIEQEKNARLEHAKMKRDYQEHCTSVIFDYECEEANGEYAMKCDTLRQDMLEEVNSEIEIINDLRKGVSASTCTYLYTLCLILRSFSLACITARKTTRKTRSTRTKGKDESSNSALDTAQKIKKRSGNLFQPLEKKLAKSEVDHDLRELSAAFEASKKRRMEAGPGKIALTTDYPVAISNCFGISNSRRRTVREIL